MYPPDTTAFFGGCHKAGPFVVAVCVAVYHPLLLNSLGEIDYDLFLATCQPGEGKVAIPCLEPDIL